MYTLGSNSHLLCDVDCCIFSSSDEVAQAHNCVPDHNVECRSFGTETDLDTTRHFVVVHASVVLLNRKGTNT